MSVLDTCLSKHGQLVHDVINPDTLETSFPSRKMAARLACNSHPEGYIRFIEQVNEEAERLAAIVNGHAHCVFHCSFGSLSRLACRALTTSTAISTLLPLSISFPCRTLDVLMFGQPIPRSDLRGLGKRTGINCTKAPNCHQRREQGPWYFGISDTALSLRLWHTKLTKTKTSRTCHSVQ